MTSNSLTVRTISPDEHLAWIASRPSVSFLQTPAWGRVKKEWRSLSLGWFDTSGTQVGAGLALLRPVPKVPKFFAYLPEGPDLDWSSVADDPGRWFDPLVDTLAAEGAFAVRIGPTVPMRRWGTAAIKAAMSEGVARTLTEVPPEGSLGDGTAGRDPSGPNAGPTAGPNPGPDALGRRLADVLAAHGWKQPAAESGFAAGQPKFVFQVPLAGRDEANLLAGFNQLWRRNIKKADKAGVVVTHGGASDLAAFHELYVLTAERDGFTPRPLSYFQGMWDAMTAEGEHRLRLYLAHHEGDLVAATTMTQVGNHAWYSYGASSTAKRDVRGSNAIQWAMLRDARSDGAAIYDLRGITETIAADDPHVGLIQFKLGTGGEAVEYVGEWTKPTGGLVSAGLYRAFEAYMQRRGA